MPLESHHFYESLYIFSCLWADFFMYLSLGLVNKIWLDPTWIWYQWPYFYTKKERVKIDYFEKKYPVKITIFLEKYILGLTGHCPDNIIGWCHQALEHIFSESKIWLMEFQVYFGTFDTDLHRISSKHAKNPKVSKSIFLYKNAAS